MSKADRKPPGGGRAVTSDEAELWKFATHALEPVKVKPRVRVAREAVAEAAGEAQSPTAAPLTPRRSPSPKPAPQRATSPKPAAPPIAEFDRRKARQIASGKVEVAARIDLHGLRQDAARAELRTFLLRAHASGHRIVLVITGKGGGVDKPADSLGGLLGERQRGVLRRSVPHWLEEPDLRAVVVRYTQAGVRHGGAGALYVQLRRPARADREEGD